jgi:hypothetical protein
MVAKRKTKPAPADQYTYRCPDCKETDTLSVTVSVHAKLIQESDGNFQTDADGDHEFSDESPMSCSCGHDGTVVDFTVGD